VPGVAGTGVLGAGVAGVLASAAAGVLGAGVAGVVLDGAGVDEGVVVVEGVAAGAGGGVSAAFLSASVTRDLGLATVFWWATAMDSKKVRMKSAMPMYTVNFCRTFVV